MEHQNNFMRLKTFFIYRNCNEHPPAPPPPMNVSPRRPENDVRDFTQTNTASAFLAWLMNRRPPQITRQNPAAVEHARANNLPRAVTLLSRVISLQQCVPLLIFLYILVSDYICSSAEIIHASCHLQWKSRHSLNVHRTLIFQPDPEVQCLWGGHISLAPSDTWRWWMMVIMSLPSDDVFRTGNDIPNMKATVCKSFFLCLLKKQKTSRKLWSLFFNVVIEVHVLNQTCRGQTVGDIPFSFNFILIFFFSCLCWWNW